MHTEVWSMHYLQDTTRSWQSELHIYLLFTFINNQFFSYFLLWWNSSAPASWYWGLSLLWQIHLLLRDVTLRRPWVMFSFICPNSPLIFCYLFSISLIYCPWQSLASIPFSLTICCFLSLSVIVLVSLQFQKIVFHNTVIHNGQH